MESRLLNAWVVALDNGGYEQGTGALCRLQRYEEAATSYTDENGFTVQTTTTREKRQYCCLGVLAEVAKEIGYDGRFEFVRIHGNSNGSSMELAWGGSTGTFNKDGLEALGLTEEAQGILAELNDKKAPFQAIAAALPTIVKACAALSEKNAEPAF